MCGRENKGSVTRSTQGRDDTHMAHSPIPLHKAEYQQLCSHSATGTLTAVLLLGEGVLQRLHRRRVAPLGALEQVLYVACDCVGESESAFSYMFCIFCGERGRFGLIHRLVSSSRPRPPPRNHTHPHFSIPSDIYLHRRIPARGHLSNRLCPHRGVLVLGHARLGEVDQGSDPRLEVRGGLFGGGGERGGEGRGCES